jgi:uncharacterized membrane protein
MANLMTSVAVLFPVVVLSLVLFLPWLLSQNGLLLGIHVTPEFRTSGEAQRLRRRYARDAGLICLSAVLLATFSGVNNKVLLMLAAIVVEVAGLFVLWITTWRRLHAHRAVRSAVRTADLAPESSTGSRWALSVLAALLPMGGAAAILALRWQVIPDRFPIHWGMNGQPNGWSDRTPSGVFGPLIIGAILIVLFAVLGALIPRFSAGFHGSKALLKLTRNLLRACAWLLGVLFGVIALLPLMHDSAVASRWLMTGTLVSIAAIVVYMIAGAQRISYAMTAAQDSTPDRCWKGGLIYYNPSDPALMVPKRLGVGYTLNLGRPMAWLVVCAILIIPIILPLILHIGSRN